MTRTRAKAGAVVCRAVRRAGAALAGAAILLMPAGAASAASTPSPAPSRAQSPARPVMILLDNNSSKGWAAIGHALALDYIRALPPNVYAGLVTFGGAAQWELVVRPTTNRSRLEAAVSGAPGAGGTHYDSDGIYAALARVALVVPRLQTPGGRLVVISNAENLKNGTFTVSIPTDVIAQRIDSNDLIGRLFPLASHSGGRLVRSFTLGHPVTPQEVTTLVAATLPPAPAPSPSPTKTLRPRPSRTPRTPVAAVSSSGASSPEWPLLTGIAALFAAVVLIAATALGKVVRVSEDRDLTGRIKHYGPQQQAAQVTEESADGGKVSRAAQDVTKRLMPAATQERLAERLDLAGVARKPAEWALLGLCLGVVVAGALSLITSFVLIGVLVGALIGWLTMRISLSMRIVKRRTSFAEQLPDTLQVVASALRAGFSLAQALDAVVREDTQPIAGELSRALAEVRLGGDLEDGLEAVADRMDSDDLRWTIMAIRIQQGVGGNLAEVLLTIAGTIRERGFLRRQIRALSAEGRLSAYILVALPILIGIWLFVSASAYMRPLYTTHVGQLMLLGACVLVVIGALWMRKLIRIKI
jgi:Flp pilus assembly protein TadB